MALTVAQLTARLTADTSNFFKAMSIADAAMFRTGSIARRVGAGIGIAVVGASVMSARAAGNFEESMLVLGAVTEGTAEQMNMLSDEAVALGKDINLPNVSAKDAADAMTELGKAGLSVNDIMGATRGVLQLGVAGNIDFAESATIVGRALTAFGLKGNEASRVADLFTATANKTTADVNDMALGVQMASAQFKAGNQPIQNLTTALGLMANAGIAGSDAGTSLKTMMNRLMAPTAKSKKAIKELGIEVYGSGGQMKKMPAIIQEFSSALQNKTDAEKDAALYTIFGSDAIRAARVVLTNGTESWNKLSEATQKGGEAQAFAEAKTAGFNGAVGALVSQIETLAIELGEALLPAATSAARGLADFMDKIDVGKITGFFGVLMDGVKIIYSIATANGQAIPMILGAVTAFGGLKLVVLPLIGLVSSLRTAIMGLTTAMAMNPVTAWTIAIGALVGVVAGFIGQANSGASAQERFNKAMDEGAQKSRDLEDAMGRITQSSLRKRAAIIENKSAQEELNRLESQGIRSGLDYERASLRLERSKVELTDATREQTRSVQDGTRTAYDAIQADARAIKAAKDKLDNLRRVEPLLRTQPEYTQKIVDATEDLARAYGNSNKSTQNFVADAKSIAKTLPGPLKAAFLEAVRSAAGFNLNKAKDNLAQGIKDIQGTAPTAKQMSQLVGTGIADGIAAGITSAPAVQAAVRVVREATAAAKEAAKIKSPSQVFRDEIGKPMAEGVAVGLTEGTMGVGDAVWTLMYNTTHRGKEAAKKGGSGIGKGYSDATLRAIIMGNEQIKSKMSSGLKAALSNAKSAISNYQNMLQRSFGRMRDRIFRGFDAITGMPTPLERQLEGQTEAEAALAKLEADRTAAGLQAREDEANGIINGLQARRDAANALVRKEGETELEYEQRKADELLRIQQDYDAAKAALEDVAYERERARLEAAAATQRASLEESARLERANWEERRLIEREALEDSLQALEDKLMAGKIKAKDANIAVLRVIRSFDKGYKNSGQLLGIEFAAGLAATQKKVVGAARAIARAIQNILELNSPAKEGPLSDLDKWWTPFSDTLLKGVDTRPLAATVTGAVTPSPGALMGAGAGGTGAIVVNVSDQTFAGMSRDQADRVARDIKAAFDRQVVATF